MSRIYPFRALRPPASMARQVASVPYDVVNTSEARELAAGNPDSFLHVSRPEIDLPDGTGVYSDKVYEKAAENFQKLIRECPLEVDRGPSLYLYSMRMGNHRQIGVAAAFSVDEYDEGLIRKHERTRRDKEDDRTRHIIALRAQTGPVLLTYRPDRRIDALVQGEASGPPLYDVTASDGVRHTIWQASAPEPLARAFTEVTLLYIADGHHRAASASRARAELRQGNPHHNGGEDYNRFLGVAFPADQVRILPYNRIIKELNSLSPGDFLKAIAARFQVSDNGAPEPSSRGEFSMYLDGRWYTLRPSKGAPPEGGTDESDAVSHLDVTILQENLLEPVLGIKDVRTDKRIDFVGGIRGPSELQNLVDSGSAAAAFSLYATTIDDLLRVSDANGIMPPKSTWFEPKLRDGFLIHCI